MDVTSIIGAVLADQTGALQTKIAVSLLKSNLDAEKSAVLTLLGAGEQNASSLANLAAGIGGNVDITA
jgi:hypothetical protein